MEKDSKIYRYLNCCDGYELRRFRVFLSSPFFNQRPEILAFWDFIRPYFPDTGVPLPAAEACFGAAYPDSVFDLAKYRHLQSDLCKLLEAFWQQQQLRQRPEMEVQLLLQALSSRNLSQDFAAQLLQAQMQLMAQPFRGADYLQHQFDLALIQHEHLVGSNNRRDYSGLQAAMEALDEAYFCNKIRIAAASINRGNVLGGQLELPLLSEVVAHIDAAPSVIYAGSLVEAYRLVLLTLQPEMNHEAFNRLTTLLENGHLRFPKATMAELYSYALNYCIRMVNLAHPGFDQQLHALYELLLARGYLLEQNQLPVPHYKNFVTLNLRLGHARSVAAQLKTLEEKLPQEYRESASTYSQAALAFALGENGKAIRLLQQVDFVDVYYHLDSKSLLLKAWFEQGEIEPLLSLIDSFLTYLRRSRKISDYQRNTYRNQIKIVQMMVRYRLGSRKPLVEIKAALERLRPIADVQWLESKLYDLQNDGS